MPGALLALKRIVPGMETIKVLVVDDHAVVRDGLSGMLGMQEDLTVVGEAENGLEAVGKAEELQPDVILMDLRMPQLDGVGAVGRIQAENPQIKVIILTTYDSDEYVFQAIKAGAKGYILKDASRDELVDAVRAVHRGASPLHPKVITRVLDRLARLSRQHSGDEVLSDREVEVLRLVSQGATNKEIAASLSITNGTARSHVANILRKLSAKDRTEAVIKAAQRGVINL